MDGRNPAVDFVVCAQGVNFRPLSYTEAIELAAKENKMVFIDSFPTIE